LVQVNGLGLDLEAVTGRTWRSAAKSTPVGVMRRVVSDLSPRRGARDRSVAANRAAEGQLELLKVALLELARALLAEQ
jgi:hypothetical protein